MVKASSCGNSSGHRFGSWFSPKSFFALISYENEHSAFINTMRAAQLLKQVSFFVWSDYLYTPKLSWQSWNLRHFHFQGPVLIRLFVKVLKIESLSSHALWIGNVFPQWLGGKKELHSWGACLSRFHESNLHLRPGHTDEAKDVLRGVSQSVYVVHSHRWCK